VPPKDVGLAVPVEVSHALDGPVGGDGAEHHRADDTGAVHDEGVGQVLGMSGPSVLFSRSWLAWSLSELGEFAEGIARGEEAVQRADALDHAFTRADAYRAIGCLYVRKGDMSAALTVLERGLKLARNADLALWFPSIGSLLGYAYALDGRSTEAISLLEQALERADALGIAAGHGLRSVWLGEAYLLAERLSEASELAARSVDLARASKERGTEGWALRLTADVAPSCHPAGRGATHAESSYRQAQALASELGMRPLDAHCHAGLARWTRPEHGPQLLVHGRLDRDADVLVNQLAEGDRLTLMRSDRVAGTLPHGAFLR
jgi:tetratricopeptide (TPR) repeat protein